MEDIKNVQVKVPKKIYLKIKSKLAENEESFQDMLLTACKRYLKRDTKLITEKVKKKKKNRE